jgi:hypothetical protein
MEKDCEQELDDLIEYVENFDAETHSLKEFVLKRRKILEMYNSRPSKPLEEVKEQKYKEKFKIGQSYHISGKNVIAREDDGENCGRHSCVFYKDCQNECDSNYGRAGVYFDLLDM